jgi:hypothetical protein
MAELKPPKPPPYSVLNPAGVSDPALTMGEKLPAFGEPSDM